MIVNEVSVETLLAGKATKPSKFKNKTCEWEGLRFGSLVEMRRYQDLTLQERAGAISGLRHHPVYELQAGFRDRQGKWQRAIHYEADAEYVEAGRLVVEDTKGGAVTQEFAIKSKLFAYRYPEIELRIWREGRAGKGRRKPTGRAQR